MWESIYNIFASGLLASSTKFYDGLWPLAATTFPLHMQDGHERFHVPPKRTFDPRNFRSYDPPKTPLT